MRRSLGIFWYTYDVGGMDQRQLIISRVHKCVW